MEIGYQVTIVGHDEVLVRLLEVIWFTKYVTQGQKNRDKEETVDQSENYNCEH